MHEPTFIDYEYQGKIRIQSQRTSRTKRILNRVFSKYYIEQNIPIYKIDIFREEDEYYEDLNQLINSSSIPGNHAMYDGTLGFIKTQMINLENLETIIPEETKEVIKKEQDRYNYSEIEETKGSNLFNSVSFRDFVLLSYQNKCAITNVAIFHDKLINLEAAHIMPKSHSGSFLPCNGIALSRDMHWAFDKGMFAISEKYEIIVHDDVKNTILNNYHGQKINLPVEDFFKPEKAFLHYHREKIFGLFKYSGVIRSSQ
ncbi:HNH endonuclease [Flavobacterium sp. UBA7680]|uniref:HNH endonuclease n=1 Tax=Flavobacterium sp. UBA7680 TaxID=1946559 RepID=UPI0025C3CEAD|nr:HNH endonuclease [Flavobacterium sp. UBA7680]